MYFGWLVGREVSITRGSGWAEYANCRMPIDNLRDGPNGNG